MVRLAAGGGGGKEIQVIPVGNQPMGIAGSPDGRTLAVANSRSDSVSLISLAADGSATTVRTVPVGLQPGGPRGSQPTAVAFSPSGNEGSVSIVDVPAANAGNTGSGPGSATLASRTAQTVAADDLLPLLTAADGAASTHACSPVASGGSSAVTSNLLCAASEGRLPAG
ncbi:MAG: hypothetical protein M0020_10755 [Actinomycetota bacterium]|nr:hypothetical protein [Actinomycetota bacterium]